MVTMFICRHCDYNRPPAGCHDLIKDTRYDQRFCMIDFAHIPMHDPCNSFGCVLLI